MKLNGLDRKSRKVHRFLIAFHEAGHAVVRWYLGMDFEFVEIGRNTAKPRKQVGSVMVIEYPPILKIERLLKANDREAAEIEGMRHIVYLYAGLVSGANFCGDTDWMATGLRDFAIDENNSDLGLVRKITRALGLVSIDDIVTFCRTAAKWTQELIEVDEVATAIKAVAGELYSKNKLSWKQFCDIVGWVPPEDRDDDSDEVFAPFHRGGMLWFDRFCDETECETPYLSR